MKSSPTRNSPTTSVDGDASSSAPDAGSVAATPSYDAGLRRSVDAAKEAAGREDAVLVVNVDGTIESVLSWPASSANDPREDLAGAKLQSIWSEEMSAPVLQNIKQTLRSRQVRSIRLSAPTARKHYECLIIAQGRDRAMLILRDISQAQNTISRLEAMAFGDKVTGLPNREWLLTELASIVDRCRLQDMRAAVIALEIGQLDLAGSVSAKATQDAILAELAARVTSALRGANRQSENDDDRYSAVARIDFHRFAVILPHIESGEDAAGVAARLTDTIERAIEIDSSTVRLKVAVGISLFPQDGDTADELLDNALVATQDAKNSGSQRQKFHSGTMRLRAIERQDLVLELRAALDNDEFALTYLPIIESEGGRVVTAEALLRWPKPLFGSRPISEVVAAAEYTGLILPIGEWIFRRACQQLVEWQEKGHRDLRIAVNVSSQEFARGRLVERTERILADTGIDARLIDIEITEHLLFRDAMQRYPVCTGLRELGVRVSVDDYGTGVCSFDHLAQSPVNSVKIHQKFVAQACSSAPSRAACAAITAMAHELGISVVAEGVETAEQAEILADIGCDYLQGFVYCEPATPDEFDAFMNSRTVQ